MADIFKLVDYDVTAPVVIHHDAEQGDVVFNVRSIDNPETAAILKRRQAKSMGARVSRKADSALSDEDVGMMMLDAISPDSETLAPCIVSWEWNGHEFSDLGFDPELTTENVRRVLDVPWIKAKVQAGVQSIQVFPKA
jgi:hypothetical protein